MGSGTTLVGPSPDKAGPGKCELPEVETATLAGPDVIEVSAAVLPIGSSSSDESSVCKSFLGLIELESEPSSESPSSMGTASAGSRGWVAMSRSRPVTHVSCHFVNSASLTPVIERNEFKSPSRADRALLA